MRVCALRCPRCPSRRRHRDSRLRAQPLHARRCRPRVSLVPARAWTRTTTAVEQRRTTSGRWYMAMTANSRSSLSPPPPLPRPHCCLLRSRLCPRRRRPRPRLTIMARSLHSLSVAVQVLMPNGQCRLLPFLCPVTMVQQCGAALRCTRRRAVRAGKSRRPRRRMQLTAHPRWTCNRSHRLFKQCVLLF